MGLTAFNRKRRVPDPPPAPKISAEYRLEFRAGELIELRGKNLKLLEENSELKARVAELEADLESATAPQAQKKAPRGR